MVTDGPGVPAQAVTLLEQGDTGNIMIEVSLILSKSYSVASLLSRDLGLDRVPFFQDQKGWNWSEKPKVVNHDEYAEARSQLLRIFKESPLEKIKDPGQIKDIIPNLDAYQSARLKHEARTFSFEGQTDQHDPYLILSLQNSPMSVCHALGYENYLLNSLTQDYEHGEDWQTVRPKDSYGEPLQGYQGGGSMQNSIMTHSEYEQHLLETLALKLDDNGQVLAAVPYWTSGPSGGWVQSGARYLRNITCFGLQKEPTFETSISDHQFPLALVQYFNGDHLDPTNKDLVVVSTGVTADDLCKSMGEFAAIPGSFQTKIFYHEKGVFWSSYKMVSNGSSSEGESGRKEATPIKILTRLMCRTKP